MRKIIIIGSGFSSLSAACYLKKAGHEVHVVEKNEQLGGRASVLAEEGFRFDMGPSWYWMPDIFERFFADFGYKVTDFYTLQKLSPAYRVYFGPEDYFDVADNVEQIVTDFEKVEKGSGKKLSRFIESARRNYDIAMRDLVYQPGISITELITPETATRLGLFIKNIKKEVSKITRNPKLRSILEFPVLFLGAKPGNTPAFYNFMNYADFGLGTWYPKGGMNEIVKAMVKVATELGVTFSVNEEVFSINTENEKVKSITTSAGTYEADIVVSGADYAHTEKLLQPEERNFDDDYWERRTFAPSSLLYYVGFKGELSGVEHHNLFFDTNFEQHAEEIYDKKIFPKRPLFYANFPSKTDPGLAPKGMQTAFFLIPVAVDLNDDKEIHEKYFNLICDRLEKITGQDFREKVVYKKSFGVQDFKSRYYSCRGNAYGLANTLLQTSVLRPGIRNKKLDNLFYTGQLTVPGPGVPPALISGKIVSDFILKNNQNE